ncbi:MAG: 50S ribosomal protein L18 [Nanobdellota archaeon]
MRTVNNRRKKEGRTNYKARLKLLVSRKDRVVIRKTLSSILVQIVRYDSKGDKVLVSAHSRDLKKYGLKYSNANIPVAYLVGLLTGKRALEKGYEEGIVDLGLQKAHAGGKIFATVKGLSDAGFKVPLSEKAVPNEKRLQGEHVKESYENNKDSFGEYKKNNIDVSSYSDVIKSIKEKVIAEK